MDNLFSHFKPPLGMRSRHMQSLLNSSGLRRRRILRSAQALQNHAEVFTLNGGSGVRLQGLYSKHAAKSRGLAVLLHGWEGSVNSSYIVANGVRLYQAGFDDNPVLRPDPERPWESHYVTSHSVMRMDDGSFRIWYASRRKPPFLNKYFAINTAAWDAPKEEPR